jgi:predicted branched-subunit amino acid permease
MKFIKSLDDKWKWKPKRWWIGLIVFWLFSTAGARLFGIEPKTSDQYGFILILTFLAVIFAAITDREYSLPKRILWVIVVPIVYEIIFALGSVIIGHQGFSAVVKSLIIVACCMRRSKYFVEQVNEIKIDEHQK